MTTTEGHRPAAGRLRSAPARHWSKTPIIDGEALVVSRASAQPDFSSRPGAARSRAAGSSRPAAAASNRPARHTARRRTLLWTAPAGLALLGVLVALAILAAPDRPVAEPLVRAALLLTEEGAR